jgi:hypothetical protein
VIRARTGIGARPWRAPTYAPGKHPHRVCRAVAAADYVEHVVAYDFPVLSLFVSMIWLFLWIAWLFLVFRTVVDIFRSPDLSGVAKALWLLAVAVLPYLGVFAYVVVRGREMSAREVQRSVDHQEELRAYVRNLAGPRSAADELTKLAELRNNGVLTEAEFVQQKSLLLAG